MGGGKSDVDLEVDKVGSYHQKYFVLMEEVMLHLALGLMTPVVARHPAQPVFMDYPL